MSHDTPPLTRPASAVSAGVKPASPRDIIWDRPVFRAPALPSHRAIFDPLPFRSFGSHRLVAGR
ncbi:MAG TPA: hypothetical protein VHC86_00010 [Opitutaceae bacterium]|nr:hypothetical protein [Opitutaceae bacterium]